MNSKIKKALCVAVAGTWFSRSMGQCGTFCRCTPVQGSAVEIENPDA